MSTRDADTAVPDNPPREQKPLLPDVPAGEMIAYQIGPFVADLCRASSQRTWMDRSAERFAYRCLPLVIANQLGWDILNPLPLRARWLGGSRPTDVQVEALGSSQVENWASGHFGEGVLTFSVGYLFRTPPGVRLLVTGPLNLPKANIFPLSGVVETDWTHASFTMNYKFTQPGTWVEFQQDEPICRIIPLSLAEMENLQGRVRSMSDSPELQNLFRQWSQSRKSFNRRLDNPFSDESHHGWQKEYFQGEQPDGQRHEGHQTKLNHREFIDERTENRLTEPAADRRKQRQPPPAAQTAQSTVYEFLWRESRPFENRSRKSVQVMSAIARMIERDRCPGSGAEAFLASYRRFCTASPEAFTEVCLEPRAYFWTRIGFQLIDALLNGRDLSPMARDYCHTLGTPDLSGAVQAHLERFAEFERAATLLEGAPRQLECPVLTVGGCSIRLQPAALAGLGVAAIEPTIAAGNDYQARHAGLIREALEAIRRYTPDIFQQVRDNVSVIALKPPQGNQYTNVSISELPGAMMLTVVNHPLVMADRIIHETHHHRLFSIEDGDALLEPNTTLGQRLARYYSPWRDDPRPIRGLLHGLYVYIAVGRFWQAVYEAADRPADRPYVVDQLLRIGKQLTLAHDVLASNARFMPIGEGAFAQMTADIAELHDRMRRSGLPDDAPALSLTDSGELLPQLSPTTNRPLSVAEAIDEHIARFEN